MSIQATELYGTAGNPFVPAPAPSVAEVAGRSVSGDNPNVGFAVIAALLALLFVRVLYEIAGE